MERNSRTGINESPSAFSIYMNITNLRSGERGIVTSVECSPALKERLRSLNVRSGGVIRLKKVSFFKKTYLIQAMGSQIALRKEVAVCVNIRKV